VSFISDGIKWTNIESKPVPDVELDKCGFTKQEAAAHAALMDFMREYMKLEKEHPTEEKDLERIVHHAQELLALRVLRRVYPQGWATYKGEKCDT
jgi:hypothetical protein